MEREYFVSYFGRKPVVRKWHPEWAASVRSWARDNGLDILILEASQWGSVKSRSRRAA